MNIGIIGTRGIPAKYGGFETFAQEISVLIANESFNVTVYCDKPYNTVKQEKYYNVVLKYMSTTKSKSPLYYYYESIRKSLRENDIILVTGCGGSIFYFLNIWKRRIIITNTDGIESNRAKWSYFQKKLIKILELFAVKYSDHLISDSKGITSYLLNTYPRLNKNNVSTIEYGAQINELLIPDYLKKYNITKDNYILVVARLEPENNIHMIIEGYLKANVEKPLIIVGNITKNKYVNSIIKYQSPKIRFIGGIFNKDELSTLRTGAYAYIHGHSVGGTNPSLLEALGSSNICICHDNIFNREVTNNMQLYFSNAFTFKERLLELEVTSVENILQYKKDARERILTYYNWANMSQKYQKLFGSLTNDKVKQFKKI